jgi:hypothetical protein
MSLAPFAAGSANCSAEKAPNSRKRLKFCQNLPFLVHIRGNGHRPDFSETPLWEGESQQVRYPSHLFTLPPRGPRDRTRVRREVTRNACIRTHGHY